MDPLTLLLSGITDAVGSMGTAASSAASGLGDSIGSLFSGTGSSAAGAGANAANAGTAITQAATPAASQAASAAAPAASSPSLFSQAASGLKDLKTGPVGNIVSALKPSAAAEPHFSGGFQGPQLPFSHDIQAKDPLAQSLAMATALKKRSLGDFLSDSPYGSMRR